MGICCNLLLFTVKLLTGLLVNSISVMADAFNNLSDAASSIISIVGVKMAEKPADEEHPFGHGRIEYISAFIVAFLVIAFMRSGNFATIALAIAATGFAGVLVLRFLPYARNRFEAWGHVWDYALTTGYSQTRSMMCIASGGLFGLGPGKGWLKYVAASDTDLVFAFVSEEWGLIMAVLMVVCIVVLACFVVRSAPAGRSCFYTIGACAAATVMVTQTILNVFGMAAFLPLTGVTFPFVSNGGSSMVCVWGLLAFIKAADTRQNASFAIRVPHGVKQAPQPEEEEADEDVQMPEDDSIWQRSEKKEARK